MDPPFQFWPRLYRKSLENKVYSVGGYRSWVFHRFFRLCNGRKFLGGANGLVIVWDPGTH